MANVTDLQERVHPGKVVLGRQMMGNGTPLTDTVLADNDAFPVGSEYLDNETGVMYYKRLINDNPKWVEHDTES